MLLTGVIVIVTGEKSAPEGTSSAYIVPSDPVAVIEPPSDARVLLAAFPDSVTTGPFSGSGPVESSPQEMTIDVIIRHTERRQIALRMESLLFHIRVIVLRQARRFVRCMQESRGRTILLTPS
jgi:hypothetical protein